MHKEMYNCKKKGRIPYPGGTGESFRVNRAGVEAGS